MCEQCGIEANGEAAERSMGYAPGRAFPRRPAAGAADYLNAALAAERWISTFAHDTAEGTYWQQDETKPLDLTFYSGSAGVAYFYMQLAQATGRESFKATAARGLAYAAAHWRDMLSGEQAAFQDNREGVPGVHLGAHMGVGGIGLVLIEGAREFEGEPIGDACQHAAEEIGRFYENEIAQQGESGPYWTGSPALLLDGGIILFLMALWHAFGQAEVLETVKAAGEQYLHWGAKSPRGGIDFNGAGIETPFDWPNFAFGSAGSGYLLVLLHDLTGDARYLQAARECGDFLNAIAVRQKHGKLIPHKLGGDDEKTVFYLGYCHGISGTLRFYDALATRTGEARWRSDAAELVDGAESLGAPEHMSAGLWNTVCACCGHAGMAHTFLGMYCRSGEQRYRDLAIRCGDVLLGTMEETPNAGACWPMAWERVRPQEFSRRIGFFDGAAGIASALLELHSMETGTYQWHRLIDDPFPSHI